MQVKARWHRATVIPKNLVDLVDEAQGQIHMAAKDVSGLLSSASTTLFCRFGETPSRPRRDGQRRSSGCRLLYNEGIYGGTDNRLRR